MLKMAFPAGADCPSLASQWSSLSAEECATAANLLEAGQAHLFAAWPPLGEKDAEKKALLAQARACSEYVNNNMIGKY